MWYCEHKCLFRFAITIIIITTAASGTGTAATTGTFAHYNDVIMATMASQITSLTIVYSAVYSGADQRKHQSSASLTFVWGIHRGPVNSPHKWPVTRKMFPFDDVIMYCNYCWYCCCCCCYWYCYLLTVRFIDLNRSSKLCHDDAYVISKCI